VTGKRLLLFTCFSCLACQPSAYQVIMKVGKMRAKTHSYHVLPSRAKFKHVVMLRHEEPRKIEIGVLYFQLDPSDVMSQVTTTKRGRGTCKLTCHCTSPRLLHWYLECFSSNFAISLTSRIQTRVSASTGRGGCSAYATVQYRRYYRVICEA
jgi:hypothetical protein